MTTSVTGGVEIISRSPSLRRALALADRFAPTPLPILLVGETGTGKELFARRIHAISGRRGPLMPINCAALPREMMESLLFGHRRGAFTGAVQDAPGFVEAANGGTLYLDELASLPADAQGKLLRVLEDKEVYRLGNTTAQRIDFRVVASAEEDVSGRLKAGAFRLDLYERIAGAVVELAPLRERVEDVIPLAEYFAGLHGRVLAPGTDEVLIRHRWPGNVRELRVAIERAGFLSDNGRLEPGVVAEAIALGFPLKSTSRLREAPTSGVPMEKHAELLALCAAHGWNAARIANALGISRSTLYTYLGKMGVSLRELRKSERVQEILGILRTPPNESPVP